MLGICSGNFFFLSLHVCFFISTIKGTSTSTPLHTSLNHFPFTPLYTSTPQHLYTPTPPHLSTFTPQHLSTPLPLHLSIPLYLSLALYTSHKERERERERGTTNSEEQKQKCNCKTNLSSKLLSLLVYKRGKERTYLYLKKRGMRKMKSWRRWWNIIHVDNWSKCYCNC